MQIHMYRNNRASLDSRELLSPRFTVDPFIGIVRVRLRIPTKDYSRPRICTLIAEYV
jgi:hypothetical protein